jgi:hypothetical protein
VGFGSRATRFNYFVSFRQLRVCYGMLIEMISGLVRSTLLIGVLPCLDMVKCRRHCPDQDKAFSIVGLR